jgi:flagellin
MQNLADAINGNSSDEGVAYQAGGGANADAVASASGTSISLSATPLGATLASIASTTTDADFGFLNGTTFTAGTSSNLLTSASATSALSAINAAIATVANERGAMGAVVNRLNAASGVESTQQTNLSSAESGIMDADMAQVTSNMSKYTILQQTGIAALQQSQQMSQSVLKLLQNIA